MNEKDREEFLKGIEEKAKAFNESLQNGDVNAEDLMSKIFGGTDGESNPLDMFSKILGAGGNDGSDAESNPFEAFSKLFGGSANDGEVNPLGDMFSKFTDGSNPFGEILGGLNTGTNPLISILGTLGKGSNPLGKGSNPLGSILGDIISSLGSEECAQCDSDCTDGTCKERDVKSMIEKLLSEFIGQGTGNGGMPSFGGNPFENIFVKEVDVFGAVNVTDLGEKYVVTSSLPGVTKSAIKVSSLDDTLTIDVTVAEGKKSKGEDAKVILNEYTASTIQRNINLPNLDSESITVKFSNGELTIEAKKLEIQPIFYDVK